MGTVLVIGGDRLGNIVELLHNHGYQKIHHISGRKSSPARVTIPSNTNMIVVLTDYVNHNLSTHIKQKAKEKNVPVLFCKRSCSSMVKALH